MIVNSKKDKEEEPVPSKKIKSNDYILVELAILNILLNAKYRKNKTKIPNFYSTVEELVEALPTKSKKYVYRVLAKLENQEYVKNITPQKRKKLVKITTKGEEAVTTIIKYLYPDKKQQRTALRMFNDSRYTPK